MSAESNIIPLPLGQIPNKAIDAVSQCILFKKLLRLQIGHDPNGAWLKMQIDNGKCLGMLAEYLPNVKGAYEWAKKAQEAAEMIWEQVAGRSKVAGHEHIIGRARRA